MFLFTLAEHLHKSIEEIMEFSTFEIELWATYLNYRNEQLRDASNKHKNNSHG
jgi:hypothetical protein